MFPRLLLALLALALTALPVHAQDARRLAATCAACHGADGRTLGMGPPLAGMPRDALVDALRGFRAGTRPGTVMPELARGYTDAEIDALAGWFAQARPPR